MDPVTLALLILVIPLIGFTLQITIGYYLPRQGDWMPTTLMGFCLVLALILFFGWFWPHGLNPLEGGAPKDVDLVEFFSIGAKGETKREQGLLNRGMKPARAEKQAADLAAAVRTAEEQLTKAEAALAEAPDDPKLRKKLEDALAAARANPNLRPSLRGDINPTFRVAFGVRLDNLCVLMLLVVTLVSFLVHLYSTSYMRDHHGVPEDRYNRFFAYLQLFSWAMLGCVLSNSLLFTFIFWELVGLCSYLLIGFYFFKDSAKEACVKAFMTTRVGDLGFFLAIMIIFAVTGSTHYETVFESIRLGDWDGLYFWGVPLLTFTAVALFLGPIGKSGQFPLHVWLPDAMEGPTPVSALIHAATMVAAGVYLLARMFPMLAGKAFFDPTADFLTSDALLVVACVGGFTAIFAATIALVQTDLKKVLAYSTVSQLGYMVVGIGTGSLVAGMFHLWTHAFFKALLFLGSGSVIHAVHSGDMRDMGGLWKKMPVTCLTYCAGTLAIAGFPWVFSGFVSKDGILAGAMAFGQHTSHVHGWIAWMPFVCGMTAATLTSFYMFRLLMLTFFGPAGNEEKVSHAHESPWQILVPLCVLAVMSTGLVAGIKGTWFNDRLDPAALGYREAPIDILGHFDVSHANDKVKAYFEKHPELKDRYSHHGHGDHGHDHDKDGHGKDGHGKDGHGKDAKDAHDEKKGGKDGDDKGHEKKDKQDGAHGGDKTAGGDHNEAHYVHVKHEVHTLVAILSIVGALLGFCLAYFFFMVKRGTDYVSGNPVLSRIRTVLENLYYVDWFYYKVVLGGLFLCKGILGLIDKYIVDNVVNLTAWLSTVVAWAFGRFDYHVTDGIVRGTGELTLEAGSSARKLQTGRLQDYLYLTVILMAGVFICWLIFQLWPTTAA